MKQIWVLLLSVNLLLTAAAQKNTGNGGTGTTPEGSGTGMSTGGKHTGELNPTGTITGGGTIVPAGSDNTTPIPAGSDNTITGEMTVSGGGTPNDSTPMAGSDPYFSTGSGNPEFRTDPASDHGSMTRILMVREKDREKIHQWTGELMKFSLSAVLFFFSLVMYYRSVRLLREARSQSPSQHPLAGSWIWLPVLALAVTWYLMWRMEGQGLILFLSSFFLTASTLPFLVASLNFTHSIYVMRKSGTATPGLSAESLASLIFSLVGFAANILKIISFVYGG